MIKSVFRIVLASLFVAVGAYAANKPVAVNLSDGKGQSVGTASISENKGSKADDYKTDPAGNAGDRIACGTITK